MNVFDFDKTIYRGDSTVDFICFLVRRHPRVIGSLLGSLPTVSRYQRGKISKTAMKERLYRCFRLVPDMDEEVKHFWAKHFRKMEPWYLACKQSSDLVISASPEFLLRIPCERLGIRPPIASRVDAATGQYDGLNCYGEEKVKRFLAAFGSEVKPEHFYSDSRSDAPMAALAEKAYLIKKHSPEPW